MRGQAAAAALALLLVGCGQSSSPQTDATTTAPDVSASGATAAEETGPPEPQATIDAVDSSPPVAPPVAPQVAPPAPAPALPTVAVTDVIDGDTIDTTAGRVRVIGIDTPERGECNFGPASSLLNRLISESGNQVVLTPVPGKDDTDRYGRLLRYVDSPSGQDLGRELIAAGLAIARYDSRDGYGAHPRETDYVALDAGTAQVPCPGG